MFSIGSSVAKFQAYLWMCYAIFSDIFVQRDTYALFQQKYRKKLLAGDI
ncbi:hypothetical protein ACFSMW_12815 [Virgibacillus halophilus]|uniref:Uncharacterized protein n=1 Tax=Tigheibacillus halophilus TaxID=361280 RepID=A0ABU5C7K3_9BACI|nr:hypothetical protein [Virgibacillus halophilus]